MSAIRRDEAFELLRSGPDGIRVWNRLRERWRPVESLRGADLSNANLHGANLWKADLSYANLEKAQLGVVYAKSADFSNANLRGATLASGDFGNATFFGADLTNTYVFYAHLNGADLRQAKLHGANLSNIDLREANLTALELCNANLVNANLDAAKLARASLCSASLTCASLRGTDLHGANLTKASLRSAVLVETNLEGANLTSCSIYGISAWDLKLKGALQTNLIISRDRETTITVDNLEVAQFIHLLLTNHKIRDIINTITSKVVLILGRFTPERKAILDAICEALRSHDYCPVLFDFEGPSGRDTHETITTLARLAQFIIADITEAKSVPQELVAIVESLPSVPVQPMIQRGEHPWGMFDHIQQYPWVLDLYEYENLPEVLSSLAECIIAPAKRRLSKSPYAEDRGQ